MSRLHQFILSLKRSRSEKETSNKLCYSKHILARIAESHGVSVIHKASSDFFKQNREWDRSASLQSQ